MFKTGDTIIVKVESVNSSGPRLDIRLTMNPADVNSNWNTTFIQEGSVREI